MVGNFELTYCLYSTMINDLGGICYPGRIAIELQEKVKALGDW
jgi:hypothetical protein